MSTAGPWRVNQDRAWSIVVDPAGVLVARVALEADAHLIAASPSLLSACQALLDAYHADDADDAIEAMKKAVAKATGAEVTE